MEPAKICKSNSKHPIFAVIEYFIDKKDNTIIILRGLPGSGKSTLANDIMFTFGTAMCCKCSADDYFYSATGEYCYNPQFISDAHVQCRQKVSKSISERKPIIIVDNTNIKTSEFLPYLSMAASHNYLTLISEPNTPWKFDLIQLAQRNVHSVQKKKLREMRESYEELRLVNINTPSETNAKFNGASLADAMITDPRRGTLYCVKVIVLPKVNSAQLRNQTRRHPVEYRQPDMRRSFYEGLDRTAQVTNWRNLLDTTPNANSDSAMQKLSPLKLNDSEELDGENKTSLLSCFSPASSLSATGAKEVKLAANSSSDGGENAYLASVFPHFDAEVLAEVHRANNCDLVATVEQLNQLTVAGAFDAVATSSSPVLEEPAEQQHQQQQQQQQQHHLSKLSSSVVEFSLGGYPDRDNIDGCNGAASPAEYVPNEVTDDVDCKDEQSLSGLINKRSLMWLHKRFGDANNPNEVGNVLSNLSDDFLSDWCPPDSVLSLIYSAFLEHIGAPQQPRQLGLQQTKSSPIISSSNSRWTPTDPLASRLSLDRLNRAFPGLSEDTAASLLADCGNSYEAAFATLLECGLEPADSSTIDVGAAANSAKSPIGAVDSTLDLASCSGKLFNELSKVSADYRARRRDCLTRAAYAKDVRAQSHYMRQASSLAQQERQERAQLVSMATNVINSSVAGGGGGGLGNAGRFKDKELDLHGMTASEAIQAIKTTMSSNVGNGLKTIRVITGHGKHSTTGPVLRPVVKNFFSQKGIQFEEPYLGCFEVRVT